MIIHTPPRLVVLFLAASLATAGSAAASPIGYVQTNLTSDIPGKAANLDPDLKNPWGMSFSATSPFWVSDQRTNLATLYNAAGVKQGLVVSVPGGPTGQVFASGSGFNLNGSSAQFMFATLSGAIEAWNGSAGTTASAVFLSSDGAVYTGLALAGQRLYAADAANGKIDVFDTSYHKLSGLSFTDPNLPSGFTPYNIQNIGGSLYVEYEKQGGPGGIVDVFDTNGNLLRRLSSDAHLDDPWGITLAPAGFGDFGGDLLVGNFGDGLINAFNPITGAFLGTLSDSLGAPLVNDGLWALGFRTGAGFDPNTLYFTAGINGEADGLFGAIQVAGSGPIVPGPVPEPASLLLLGSGLVGLARRRCGGTAISSFASIQQSRS
jgi:uncharacterized protein (TIGR03118 family)